MASAKLQFGLHVRVYGTIILFIAMKRRKQTLKGKKIQKSTNNSEKEKQTWFQALLQFRSQKWRQGSNVNFIIKWTENSVTLHDLDNFTYTQCIQSIWF